MGRVRSLDLARARGAAMDEKTTVKEEGGAAEGAEPVVEEEGAEGADGVEEDGLEEEDGDEVRGLNSSRDRHPELHLPGAATRDRGVHGSNRGAWDHVRRAASPALCLTGRRFPRGWVCPSGCPATPTAATPKRGRHVGRSSSRPLHRLWAGTGTAFVSAPGKDA